MLWGLLALAMVCGAQPVALLLPGESKLNLELQQEGLALLSSINKPIVVITVIGPYRSGKSFLLNQMIGVGCDDGFGVGHNREAQTKGIWLWPPQDGTTEEGEEVALVYVDTEGFQGTGKSDVYDDRVFALAAMISSTLIYNLPETIKEADIEKLSFAVELAEEFIDRADRQQKHLQLPRLLWLIQRDFLEGTTVPEMLENALAVVPNPEGSEDIEHLNQIRASLKDLSLQAPQESMGLPQPHLERTKLCELKEDELESTYLIALKKLKSIVASMHTMRRAGDGSPLRGPSSGKDFAAFVQKIVHALNDAEIPSARSITEAFNKDMASRVVEEYTAVLKAIRLPIEEHELEARHRNSTARLLETYRSTRYGTSVEAEQNLVAELETLLGYRMDANRAVSFETCEKLLVTCEAEIVHLADMTLPSLGKFQAGLARCNVTFETDCVGPSKRVYRSRLAALQKRETDRFRDDFNNRLFRALSFAALVAIPISRFLLSSGFLELLAWAAFLFLEIAPKLSLLQSNFFENEYWRTTAHVYERAVYNEFYDLNAHLVVAASCVAVIFFWLKCGGSPRLIAWKFFGTLCPFESVRRALYKPPEKDAHDLV